MAKGKKSQAMTKLGQRTGSEKSRPGTYSAVPRNYLSTGPAAVRQSLRQTLNWAYVPAYKTLTGSSFVGFFNIVLNGPYDPDNAVGGTSAHGFAKYMAFYSKCFVLGARIKVKGTKTAASTPGALMGMNITTTASTSVAAVTSIQDGYCVYQVVNSYPDRFSLELACDVAKFLDKPDVMDDPQLFCTSSANPSQIIVANIWGSNYSVTSEFVTFVIEVEFDCIFTDPVEFT